MLFRSSSYSNQAIIVIVVPVLVAFVPMVSLIITVVSDRRKENKKRTLQAGVERRTMELERVRDNLSICSTMVDEEIRGDALSTYSSPVRFGPV